MPIEEFEKTEFCSLGLGPALGSHQMGTILAEANTVVYAFTLNRIHSPFTERDRAVLNLVYPHLSLSYHNVRALARAQRSLQGLQEAVEMSPGGYVFVNHGREIEWLTAKARQLFQQFHAGETTDSKGVPQSVRAWLRKTLGAIAKSDLVHTGHVLERTRDGQKLELRLVPSQLGGWILAAAAHSTEVQPRFRNHPDLSVRENEVLRWMTEGKRNGEIAVILGISPRTVERHVAAVLEKMQVENRASAIVCAMQWPTQKPA